MCIERQWTWPDGGSAVGWWTASQHACASDVQRSHDRFVPSRLTLFTANYTNLRVFLHPCQTQTKDVHTPTNVWKGGVCDLGRTLDAMILSARLFGQPVVPKEQKRIVLEVCKRSKQRMCTVANPFSRLPCIYAGTTATLQDND